jgi:hypothetical protein
MPTLCLFLSVSGRKSRSWLLILIYCSNDTNLGVAMFCPQLVTDILRQKPNADGGRYDSAHLLQSTVSAFSTRMEIQAKGRS